GVFFLLLTHLQGFPHQDENALCDLGITIMRQHAIIRISLKNNETGECHKIKLISISTVYVVV
ncbi:hypothetical protein L0244_14940, partial [bacterium]|nr:hypothetical protein [bacterium]